MSRRPKLRALWLKEGDKSTQSFHRVANFNRRNNSIKSQLVNGSISSDQTKIRDHIVQFYDRVGSIYALSRREPLSLTSLSRSPGFFPSGGAVGASR
jgi:hypothetical protein